MSHQITTAKANEGQIVKRIKTRKVPSKKHATNYTLPRKRGKGRGK